MKVRFRELSRAFHEDHEGQMTDEDVLHEEWITMEVRPTQEELLSFESPFDWQFWEENTLHALDRAFLAAGVNFQVWNPDRYEFQVLEDSLTTAGLERALEKISSAQSLDDLIRGFDSQGIAPLEGDAWDGGSMKKFLRGIRKANFFEGDAHPNVVDKIDRLLAN